MKLNNLNGWQRIGVIWSGIFILGAIVDFFLSFDYYMRNTYEIFDAHYPIIFFIAAYWIVYYLFIWVKEGFQK